MNSGASPATAKSERRGGRGMQRRRGPYPGVRGTEGDRCSMGVTERFWMPEGSAEGWMVGARC